jgi:hypothetical protein
MKVATRGRKVKKMDTVTNRRKKKKSKFVLSTLSVDDFMKSAFDGLGDSGDRDFGDINNDRTSNDVTRAIIGDQQEQGICLCRVLQTKLIIIQYEEKVLLLSSLSSAVAD